MLKKLPSLSNIINNLKAAVIRFPLAVAASLAGTITGLFMIHNHDSEMLPKLLMSIGLAFPLFVSAVLYFEGRDIKKIIKISVNTAIVLFLAVYYYYLPDSLMNAEEMIFFRFVFWVAGFSLLVTFVKFLFGEEGKIAAFWQYNRRLLLGLALTALYALTIMFGLFIALSSVNYLFDLNIDADRYAEIMVVMVGFFSPLFFLSRLPRDFGALTSDDSYPKELKLFAQFVLTPLVSLYFLILYAYVVRILITGEWPKGTLAYMIIGFSFAGVLTYIVLYPLRDKVRWISRVGQIFFIVLIPQVGMLFWSLWFRISEYGITEKRYLVFIFGLWLLALAFYILINKKKDIRLIPATIFIIILLASFGPWGAFAVSRASQGSRLEGLLAGNNMLENGLVKKPEDGSAVSFEDRKEISAIIFYLYRTHGASAVQPYFAEDIRNFIKTDRADEPERYYSPYRDPIDIVEEGMGINYVEQWEGARQSGDNFSFFAQDPLFENALDVSGFDYISNISQLSGTIKTRDGGKYRYEINKNTGIFEIFKDEKSLATLDLSAIINSLSSGGDLRSPKMAVGFEDEVIKTAIENEHVNLVFYITNINGEKKEDAGFEIFNLQGYLLFSLKDKLNN